LEDIVPTSRLLKVELKSVLAPQMWTDDRSSIKLPAESAGMFELRHCTADTSPFHPETGNGSENVGDVIPSVGTGMQAYIKKDTCNVCNLKM